jgi:anion-transporting  ArsA/GET3 family ATPase
VNLRIPLAGRIGPLAKAFDFVATAAPGVREILTVGKFCWEVREGHYDLVVVDAPASGHIVSQLGAPQAINDLVRVGQIRTQTDWMLDILSNPDRTGVVAVTTPEEMPVAETLELAGRIATETTAALVAVVVNRVLPELFSTPEEEVFEQLREPATTAALSAAVGGDAAPVLEAARVAVTMRRSRAVHLSTLQHELDPAVPVLLVPYLFTRVGGLRSTRQVAAALADELGL